MRRLPLYRKKPIPNMSNKEKVRRRSRAQVYLIVANRARGVCEMPDCFTRQDPLNPHHVFGRGTKAGIDTNLCETPQAILGVCDLCHAHAHAGHDGLLDKAGWAAILMLTAMIDVRPQDLVPEHPWPAPVEIARRLTQWGIENGYEWNSV